MKIFSGEQNALFAQNVCRNVGVVINSSEVKRFSDGEFTVALNETVRGETVYLIQSTFQPSDNLIELLMMADAAKRAGAKSIVAIIPYFGFSRQDKKEMPRTPIGAALVSKMIEMTGINHVITMDLHAEQIQGFFNIQISHLYSSVTMVPSIKNCLFDRDLIICAPDAGAAKRAKAYCQYFQTDMVVCYKYREEANKVKELKVIGSVEGKDVLIVDDLIDTAGTLCKCADVLMQKGAKSVHAAITHPILSGNAYENISNSVLENLFVTNSIPLKNQNCEKIRTIDVTSLFGSVIKNIENNSSISGNFLI